MAKKVIGRPFKKGEGGRPKGSRNKLGEQFIEALYENWRANGAEALEKVRIEDPAAYLKVIVSVLPKMLHVEGELQHQHEHQVLSDANRRILDELAGCEEGDTSPAPSGIH